MKSVNNDPFPGKIPSLPQVPVDPIKEIPTPSINPEIFSSVVQSPSYRDPQPMTSQFTQPAEIETLEREIEILEDEGQEIQELLAHIETLNPDQSAKAKKWVDKVGDKVIERLLQDDFNASKKEEEDDPASSLSSTLSAVTNQLLLEHEGADLTGDHSDFFEPLLLEEAFFREVAALEIGVVAVNVLSRAGTAMATGMLLSKVGEVIKAKENRLNEVNDAEKESLKKEVQVLKKWLEIQTTAFNKQLKNSLVMSSLSLPKATSGIINLLGNVGSTAGEAVGFIGLGATLIRSAIKIHETQADIQEHQVWTQAFHGVEAQDAQSIVDKQRAVFESRLIMNQPVLNKLLNSILKDLKNAGNSEEKQAEAVLKAIGALKEAGISIPFEKKLSAKELQAWLADPLQKPLLNKMMVQKKEALSVSIRNSLKTFSKKKEEIDKGFLKLSLNKAKGLFSAAVVVTVLTIILKVLVIVGITAASVALVATGYGMLVVVLGLMIVGGVYLYVKKPNLFKTYVQGVQANLFFRKIPLAIQNYRRHYTQLQASRVAEDVKAIGVQILAVDRLLDKGGETEILAYLKAHPSKKVSDDVHQALADYKLELKEERDKKVQRYQSLSGKVESLNRSVSEMEVKVNELKERIEKAGWKDFHRLLNDKEHLTDRQGNTLDYADVLTDFLLEDPTLLEDSETEKLLEYMEVDMKAIRALPRDAIKNESLRVVRSFFAMEEDATLKMIKKQKIKRSSMVGNE